MTKRQNYLSYFILIKKQSSKYLNMKIYWASFFRASSYGPNSSAQKPQVAPLATTLINQDPDPAHFNFRGKKSRWKSKNQNAEGVGGSLRCGCLHRAMSTVPESTSEEKPALSLGEYTTGTGHDSQALGQAATPWVDYAVQQARIYQKTIEETLESAIEASRSRLSQIRSTSSAHLHQTVVNSYSHYLSFTSVLWLVIKEKNFGEVRKKRKKEKKKRYFSIDFDCLPDKKIKKCYNYWACKKDFCALYLVRCLAF